MYSKRISWFFLGIAILCSLVAFAFFEYQQFASQKIVSEHVGIPEKAKSGTSFNTRIHSGENDILVHIALPEQPRFSSGAPIVVYVPAFFSSEKINFDDFEGLTDFGAIEMTFLYPGKEDINREYSEGREDYGGDASLLALRDVLRFATGEIENVEGNTLDDLSEITPVFDNVGMYAFSHPGILATKVMAVYGEDLSKVSYIVGRENPTTAGLIALEFGRYEEDGREMLHNPLYSYPEDYQKDALALDYASLVFEQKEGGFFFDVNGNGLLDVEEYSTGDRAPKMFGKKFYSPSFLEALEKNGVFSQGLWPKDLATFEEAKKAWSSREAVHFYPMLSEHAPFLHVMLLFADKDHVQTAQDKPHIHQAYDGFSETVSWVRLNPDSAYIEAVTKDEDVFFTEHDANTEPQNWLDVDDWAYSADRSLATLVPFAGVLEMIDRTEKNVWTEDLSTVLFE